MKIRTKLNDPSFASFSLIILSNKGPYPFSFAHSNGVKPFSSLAVKLAPASINILQRLRFPFYLFDLFIDSNYYLFLND